MISNSKTSKEDIQAQALAYLKNELTEADRSRFEERLVVSEGLREELSRARSMLDALAKAGEGSVVDLVYDLIREGIRCGASDLHLVPQRDDVLVRMRIDGWLQDLTPLPKEQQQVVVDRWKVLADMSVSERRLPQDGRIPIKYQEKDFDLRVNILPTLFGERVTVRIVNRSGGLPNLSLYKDSPAALEALQRLARLGKGLILTGGGVDSGKSTLLYGLIREAFATGRPGRNFLTVEDPVEMQLKDGISQTAVDEKIGLTFAGALKAIRRADPDVVMCALVRDSETADAAIGLALLNCLVMGALPATEAIGVIERLRELDIENHRIADAVAGLVGQRLIRRIDSRQTEEYQPDPEALERIGLTLEDGPFVRGIPTEANNNTGFSGRLPLLEVVEMTPELRRLIADGASVEALRAAAFPDGSGSLLADARAKIKAGLTTVEEAAL